MAYTLPLWRALTILVGQMMVSTTLMSGTAFACSPLNAQPNWSCADGNNVNNDGCSAVCQREPGFVCGPTQDGKFCHPGFWSTSTSADTERHLSRVVVNARSYLHGWHEEPTTLSSISLGEAPIVGVAPGLDGVGSLPVWNSLDDATELVPAIAEGVDEDGHALLLGFAVRPKPDKDLSWQLSNEGTSPPTTQPGRINSRTGLFTPIGGPVSFENGDLVAAATFDADLQLWVTLSPRTAYVSGPAPNTPDAFQSSGIRLAKLNLVNGQYVVDRYIDVVDQSTLTAVYTYYPQSLGVGPTPCSGKLLLSFSSDASQYSQKLGNGAIGIVVTRGPQEGHYFEIDSAISVEGMASAWISASGNDLRWATIGKPAHVAGNNRAFSTMHRESCGGLPVELNDRTKYTSGPGDIAFFPHYDQTAICDANGAAPPNGCPNVLPRIPDIPDEDEDTSGGSNSDDDCPNCKCILQAVETGLAAGQASSTMSPWIAAAFTMLGAMLFLAGITAAKSIYPPSS